MLVIPALRRLRQEALEFKASMDYITLKKNQKILMQNSY
jgi:hypothetical protein